MNKFEEVSAKTKEKLMETFKEFYLEIYHKNKKNLLKRKIKTLKCLKIYKNKKIIHVVKTYIIFYFIIKFSIYIF